MTGAGVGLGVGAAVGNGVGLGVGAAVGDGVGLGVGAAVGDGVGLGVGAAVGNGVGAELQKSTKMGQKTRVRHAQLLSYALGCQMCQCACLVRLLVQVFVSTMV